MIFKNIVFILYIFPFCLINNVIAIEPTPTDLPVDSRLYIYIRDMFEGCVYVKLESNVYYPKLDYIASKTCKNTQFKFHFDVLGRISYKFEVTKNKIINLCLSEQTVFKNGRWVYDTTYKWNYLIFKPCVTDDPRQQWRYETGSSEIINDRFVNVGSGYQVGEMSWTLASSPYPDTYTYHFTISRYYNTWLKLKAEPTSYQYTLDLQWLWNGTFYRIFNNGTGELRYDPVAKQVSYLHKGKLYCLTTNHLTQPESVHKAWVSWERCYDKYIAPEYAPIKHKWVISSVNNLANQQTTQILSTYPTVLADEQGNILRVKQEGKTTGRPYTYKADYITEDMPSDTNPVTSLFYSASYHADWNALMDGNNIRNLKSCPADGVLVPDIPKPKKTSLLPANFTLTDKWMERLYKIVTTPQSSIAIGFCSTCAFQSMEIIMNFDKYKNKAPSTSAPGLLFKDLSRAPVEQFKAAYPEISARISDNFDRVALLALTRNAFIKSEAYDPQMNEFFNSIQSQNNFQSILRGARVDPILTESIRAPKDRAKIPDYLVPVV